MAADATCRHGLLIQEGVSSSSSADSAHVSSQACEGEDLEVTSADLKACDSDTHTDVYSKPTRPIVDIITLT